MIKYNKAEIEDNNLIVDFYEEGGIGEMIKMRIKGVRIDTSITYGKDTPFIEDELQRISSSYSNTFFIPEAKNELIIITPILEDNDLTCKEEATMKKAVYNKNIIANKGINFLKEFDFSCNIPKGFIDFILKRKALEYAIDTCNFDLAYKYWNYITGSTFNSNVIKNCGCNG